MKFNFYKECTIATLIETILSSNECKKDPNFVQENLSTVVIERQEREKMKLKFEQERELEEEKFKLAQEKLKFDQEKKKRLN